MSGNKENSDMEIRQKPDDRLKRTKDDQEPSLMAIYLKRGWQMLSNLTDNIEDYAIEMSQK